MASGSIGRRVAQLGFLALLLSLSALQAWAAPPPEQNSPPPYKGEAPRPRAEAEVEAPELELELEDPLDQAGAPAAELPEVTAPAPTPTSVPPASTTPPTSTPAASAPPPTTGGIKARVHGHVAIELFAPIAGKPAAERAEELVTAFEELLAQPLPEGTQDTVEIEFSEGLAFLSVGPRQILVLGPRDAYHNGETTSLRIYAEEVRTRLETFLATERSRKVLANTILNWSLVVFFGLLLFLSLPKVGHSTRQARKWLHDHHDELPSLHIREVELISRGAVQNLLMILSSTVGFLLRIGLIYGYIVVSLGLFETTASWVPTLNAFLASPFSRLTERIVTIFPSATLSLAVVVVIVPLYQITGQIFDSISEGDIEWSSIPPHAAIQLKRVFRIALIVGSMLLFAPLVSDDPDSLVGALAKAALLTLGVGLVPLTTSLLWGLILILGSGYRRGAWFETSHISGTIEDLGLLELVVREDGGQRRHRIPNLWLFVHPVRVAPKRPPTTVEISIPVDRQRPSTALQLARAAQKVHSDAVVEVSGLSADAIHYQASLPSEGRGTRQELLSALTAVIYGSTSSSSPSPPTTASSSSPIVKPEQTNV